MTAPPLKVLVISHLYPTPKAPAQGIFVHRHVHALVQAGVEVRVVCPVPWAPPPISWMSRWKRYGGVRGWAELDGVPVLYVPFPVVPLRPYLGVQGGVMAGRLLPVVRRLRQRFPFQIIHSHTLTPDGLAGLIVSATLDVPAVCSIRGSDINCYPFEDRLRSLSTRWVLRRTDRVTAVSGKLAERAIEFAGLEVPPAVIYNGVRAVELTPEERVRLRERYHLPRDGRVIMFVGRCEQDKGVEELLEAFRALQSVVSDAHLVLVGGGSAMASLKARARAWDLSPRVHFTGTVPASDVAGLLALAHVFALPSWSEGMPNALLEAMAAGLPCVATPVGGVPEILRPEHNGLLAPVRDRAALRAQLSRLLTEPPLAEQLGRAAAETVRSQLSWERNAREYIGVYHEVLSP